MTSPSEAPSPEAFSTEDRRLLVETMQSLSSSGLVTGTSGNVSLRRGDTILITPSGVDYDVLEPGMLAAVSMSGQLLDESLPPSSETPLHLAIYRDTSATSVVHTHSPYATAVGLVVDELPSVHYAIRALGGPVKVAPYATFGSAELAEPVQTRQSPSLLMRCAHRARKRAPGLLGGAVVCCSIGSPVVSSGHGSRALTRRGSHLSCKIILC